MTTLRVAPLVLAASLLVLSPTRAQEMDVPAPIGEPGVVIVDSDKDVYGDKRITVKARECCEPHWLEFKADYLRMQREAFGCAPDIVGGTDAFSLNDLDLNARNGYRLQAGAGVGDWLFEGGYTEFQEWQASRTGSLTTGVGFDEGIGPGNTWNGTNFINDSTLFSAIHHAALLETDEHDGLGPDTGAFAGDTVPAFALTYRSEMDSWEANLKPREYTRGRMGGWRVGMGYSRVELDEFASVGLAGFYRAVNVALPNAGLTDATVTSPLGGGLTLNAGLGNGFSEADVLALTYNSTVGNELHGFQLLYDAVVYDGRYLELTANLKGGVYDNNARGVVTERYSDGDSTYGRDFTDETHSVAFMGTVALGGKFWLNRNVSLTSGYELTYLSGLALAPDQVVTGGTSPVYNVNTDGDIFMHGYRVGVEGRW